MEKSIGDLGKHRPAVCPDLVGTVPIFGPCPESRFGTVFVPIFAELYCQ